MTLPNMNLGKAAFPNANHNIISVNEGTATDVATPSSTYSDMWGKWELVEDIRGGTMEMRKKASRYLPKNPRETDDAWKARVQMSYLYNVYNRTLTALTGMAFMDNINAYNVPPELEFLLEDVDGTGTPVSEFAYEMAINAVHYGVSHAYCDFAELDAEAMNLAEFRQAGFRPKFSLINPRNLIGWRTDADKPGEESLTQIRITEAKVVPSESNQYLDKNVYFVRVVHPTFTEIHRNDAERDQGYELIKEVPNTLGYIPLVTAYGNKTGFLMGEPTMFDLAELNVRHLQSSSEQTNILHYARIPLLFGKGLDEDSLSNASVGAGSMLLSDNIDASVEYVEHSGQAISAGRQELMDIEKQMGVLGGDLLISRGVSRMTSFSRAQDAKESMSVLVLALRSVENAIEKLFQIAGEWLGVDGSGVNIAIGEQSSIVSDPNPVTSLITLWRTGLLTDQQAIDEARRQGILSEFFQLADDRADHNTHLQREAAEQQESVEHPTNNNQPTTNNQQTENNTEE